MGREHKYKFWSKIEKRFLTDYDLRFTGINIAFTLPDIVPIQYTNLKDKNGKEIYGFDVIIHNDNQYVIRYSDNLGMIALATTKEYSSFEGIVKRNHRYRDQAWLYNVQKYLSVIGNVFENPELLGDTK